MIDVREEGGEVLHVLDGPAPASRVFCEIDAVRRKDHVQQHHGQHLLSAAFAAIAGAATLSFHLGEESCTLDLDRPLAQLTPAVLRASEAAANDLVYRDLPVTAREFSPAELARLPLRKEPVLGTRVVVVSVAPLEPGLEGAEIIDASPCGGTHPPRTGGVGGIAVLRALKWGAGTRVEFACGGRVVAALAETGRRLQEAASALRCAPAEVPTAAKRAVLEGVAREKELERLLAALAETDARRLAAAFQEGPVWSVVSPPVQNAAAWIRALARALASMGRTALLGAVEDGRAYLAFARPAGSGPHLGERLRAAAVALGGNGGGAPTFAQGGGPDVGKLEEALSEASRGLEL